METSYLNKVHSETFGETEPFYVYNVDQLTENCTSFRNIYPPDTLHHYDICANPNLSMVRIILEQLGGRVVIPDQNVIDYLKYADLSEQHALFMNESAFFVGNLQDSSMLVSGERHICANSEILIPNDVFLKIKDDLKFWEHMETRGPSCIIDVSKITREISETTATALHRITKQFKIRISVIHGADLFYDVSSLWFKVLNVKTIKGKNYAILNGGINLLADASRSGNCQRHKYSITALHPDSEADCLEPMTFCGPLCTPQDMLSSELQFSELLPGETITISNIGSELYHKSPHYFISHSFPKEFAFTNGSLHPLISDHPTI